MPWNKFESKDIKAVETKVSPGAPIAYIPGVAGTAYKDTWDIERAYKDGVSKIVWVFRCIDAIAGNQARLPMVLRKDNSPDGLIILGPHKIKELLNTTPNVGENSFVFRYRLSAQLLTGTRGAFIEVVRDRTGMPLALHLLPPGTTAPIPDPKTFVKGFEVLFPSGDKEILKPENVIWVRRPHPLNPYLSITPLESAGLAIEIETLAKLYNRNFLLNDGRPGGIIIVKGELEDEDKEELKSRFSGGVSRSGAVTVLASEEGAEFVDTGSTPRDASYIQMRTLVKEEILAAFGVPESIIGNASGRTFANAAEEGKVFWHETMGPHLELIARGFDALDPELWVGFDLDVVPSMILARQQRSEFFLREKQTGLISTNEYRVLTGRKEVKSELADALLDNPNLTPTGNTKKATPPPGAVQQPGATPLDVLGGAPPGAPGAPAAMPPGAEAPPGAIPSSPTPGGPPVPGPQPGNPPTETLSTDPSDVETKQFTLDAEWVAQTETNIERWEEIARHTIKRFLERQQRVVLEKSGGAKAKKQLASGSLNVAQVFDEAVWNTQLREDLRPVFMGIMAAASEQVSQKSANPVSLREDRAALRVVDSLLTQAEGLNRFVKGEIEAAAHVASTLTDEDGSPMDVNDKVLLLKRAVSAVFVDALAKQGDRFVSESAETAYSAGLQQAGRLVNWTI